MVNLAKYGFIGFAIFMFLLMGFECFTVLVGHVISVLCGFTGLLWWITVILSVVVLNVLFIEIN